MIINALPMIIINTSPIINNTFLCAAIVVLVMSLYKQRIALIIPTSNKIQAKICIAVPSVVIFVPPLQLDE